MAGRKKRTASCPDAAATAGLGRALSEGVGPGTAIHLSGELGSGKTTFAKGLLAGCGVQDEVTSPSYSLVEVYEGGGLTFCHLDLYRCAHPGEWLESGLAEQLDGADVSLVEWPERAGGLPSPDLEAAFARGAEGAGREVLLRSLTARGDRLLAALR